MELDDGEDIHEQIAKGDPLAIPGRRRTTRRWQRRWPAPAMTGCYEFAARRARLARSAAAAARWSAARRCLPAGPTNWIPQIMRALDMGASGVIVPTDFRTGEQAKLAASLLSAARQSMLEAFRNFCAMDKPTRSLFMHDQEPAKVPKAVEDRPRPQGYRQVISTADLHSALGETDLKAPGRAGYR